MSLIYYLLGGYLLLFGLVAFGIYAACIMAARADRAEEELRKQKKTGKVPVTNRLAISSAQPAALEPAAVSVDSEHEPSYT